MMFLDESNSWPRDLGGNYVFLVKAVEEMAREIRKKEVRIPPCVYRYNISLPLFANSSAEDRMMAAHIINNNMTRDQVEISEGIKYRNTSEDLVRFEAAHISQEQWSIAIAIIQISKTVPVENVTNAIAITAAIFAGVVRGMINAVYRAIGDTEFHALAANRLNLDQDELVKARLALGQITPRNPYDFNPQGSSHIFLESTSLDRWKNSGGRRDAALEIAHRKLIRLAESHPNGLPSHLVKDTLMDKDHTGFVFDEKERKLLWERLPDKPFKLPGVRRDPSRKGSA